MPKRPKQNSDHPHRHHTPTIDNEAIAKHLEALLTPAVFAQQKYYKQLGLRDRILNLSLMVAAVLTLLWRQVQERSGVKSFVSTRRFFMVSSYQSCPTIALRKIFSYDHSLKDRLIQLGTGRGGAPVLTLRLIEIKVGKTSYSYITSVLDPQILPPYVVADLYRRRWRIEEAFYVVKRLLGLSYLWTGSINGVKLQVWATWLFYSVLVDLGDAVADELSLPFDRISLEMIFRGLYHFSVANDKGKADDPIKYFAAPENQDLGVVKYLRKPISRLNLSAFPAPS
jgi:hypothetical protein